MEKIRMEKANNVYHVLETITVTLVAMLMLFLLATIPSANFWVTNTTVLNDIRLQSGDDTVRIIGIERGFYAPSLVYTKNKQGNHAVYAIDSNILFDYMIKEIE